MGDIVCIGQRCLCGSAGKIQVPSVGVEESFDSGSHCFKCTTSVWREDSGNLDLHVFSVLFW